MEKLMSALYSTYVLPNIEDEETVQRVSALYQELTPAQGKQCAEIQRMYASKAFLLGVRTGARLERMLGQELT